MCIRDSIYIVILIIPSSKKVLFNVLYPYAIFSHSMDMRMKVKGVSSYVMVAAQNFLLQHAVKNIGKPNFEEYEDVV